MSILSRFGKDQEGATAVLFGLALLPLMGFAGAAVDYGRASAARNSLQRAVDATAIALVRDAPRLSATELTTRGDSMVRAYLKDAPGLVPASVSVSRDSKTVRVAASGTMKTAFMGLAGIGSVDLATEATAAWGSKKVELALVLDNTGSMNEVVSGRRKIDELKNAANDLLATLRNAAAEPDAVKVGIVPFDTEVRLDPSANRTAWWLRLAAADRGKWAGYVTDRDYDPARGYAYDASDATPVAGRPETLYPTVLGSRTQDLAPVQPLVSAVDGYDRLKTTVAAMRPLGCTNITIGAAWGSAMLSASEPLNQAAAPSKNLEKVMIIVTDGDNTKSRYDGDCREGTSASARIDQRTELACREAKSKGIRVVTIRLIEGNAKLLKGCASLVTDPADPFYRNGEPLYHDVRNPADLRTAFNTIAGMILSTRLTH